MSMKSLVRRISQRYRAAHAKRASIPDLMWGVDQMEGVATTLQDIVQVWEGRGPSVPGGKVGESLADVYSQVAKASNILKGMTKALEQQARTLRNVHAKPLPAVTEAKRAATRPGTLDQKTKTAVNRALEKAGMGGKKKFEKAQHALGIIQEILGQVGIEFDEIVNSHHFSFPFGELGSGHFTVRLAFSDSSGQDRTVPIRNSMLSFSFEELSKYKFEVIAYLS